MEHADTLRAIAAMLDGTEWNTGMLEEIAELLRQAGCEVRELGYMQDSLADIHGLLDEADSIINDGVGKLRTEGELHDGDD